MAQIEMIVGTVVPTFNTPEPEIGAAMERIDVALAFVLPHIKRGQDPLGKLV